MSSIRNSLVFKLNNFWARNEQLVECTDYAPGQTTGVQLCRGKHSNFSRQSTAHLTTNSRYVEAKEAEEITDYLSPLSTWLKMQGVLPPLPDTSSNLAYSRTTTKDAHPNSSKARKLATHTHNTENNTFKSATMCKAVVEQFTQTKYLHLNIRE